MIHLGLANGLVITAAGWLPAALALTTLAVFAATVLIWGSRRRSFAAGRIASTATARLWSAALLRTGALAAVLAALAGAQRVETVHEDRLAVAALLDGSASMGPDERVWVDQQLEEIAAALHADDSLAVIRFGAEAVLALPPGAPERAAESAASIDPQATNIMAALDGASALAGAMPLVTILLTDGNQTRGDATAAAQAGARRGLRIFPLAPRREHETLGLESVRAPAAIRHGEDAHFAVALGNGSSETRDAVLIAREWDRELGRIPVRVPPGRSVVDVSLPVEAPGHYRIDFALEALDGRTLGQSSQAALSVLGRPRVLVIGARPTLARALEGAGFEVEASPRLEVTTAGALDRFHAVVIGEATPADLPEAGQRALADFVVERGGGLVLAGARGLVTDKKLENSPLAAILPVGVREEKPKPRQRAPFALVLIIDRSSSMIYGVTLDQREPSRMSYARDAALSVLAQLEDRDLVGLIAFDTKTTMLAPVAPLGPRRGELMDLIARIAPSGGTDFKEALEIALAQLRPSDNPVQHIILLTDGASIRPAAEHEEVIEELRRTGISVTSIRIGDDKDTFALIQDISSRTGGAFHHVKDAVSLPNLMVEDARRHAGREEDAAEPPFRPRFESSSAALAGFEDQRLPILRAWADVPARSGAEVWIEREGTDSRQPILAAWQNGLGRVAVFTANAGEEWQAWRHARRFWAQLVRWAARPRSDDEVVLRVEEVEGQPVLEIRTFDAAAHREPLRVNVHRRDGRELQLTAMAVAEGRFEVTLPPLAEIEPRVVVSRAGPSAASPGEPPPSPAGAPTAPSPAPESGRADVAWSREEWLPRAGGARLASTEDPEAPPDRRLLERLAQVSGGQLDAPLSTILARAPADRQRTEPLLAWLVLVALLCAGADIALRQFRRGR